MRSDLHDIMLVADSYSLNHEEYPPTFNALLDAMDDQGVALSDDQLAPTHPPQ